jgi:hypothetical protein
VFSNGSFVVTRTPGSNYDEAAAVYNKHGRLIGISNKISNFGTNYRAHDVAVQSDDKIILLNAVSPDPASFRLTRLLAVTSNGNRTASFDIDETADIAVYRPANRTFYALLSLGGSNSATASASVSGIIPENYRSNGSGQSGFVYWSAPQTAGAPATFFGNFDFNEGEDSFQWGVNGDVPVGGDYDGDNRTEFTVFRPSNGTWYIFQSRTQQFSAVQWGQSGDKLVPADYDYDGITDIAVFRPSNGTWYVRRSSDNGLTAFQFGISSDIPLTGDFDGDGRADFAVYRPSSGTWYLQQTTAGFRAVQFGISTDQPVPGDYDGDGRHDVAVFREGVWYILASNRGFYAVRWGTSGDVPVSVRYAY